MKKSKAAAKRADGMRGDRWAGGQLEGTVICKMPNKLYLTDKSEVLRAGRMSAKHTDPLIKNLFRLPLLLPDALDAKGRECSGR